MSDKIVIGEERKRYRKSKREDKLDLFESDKLQIGVPGPGQKNEQLQELDRNAVLNTTPDAAGNTAQESEPIPLDESVWGNDYSVIKRLNEQQLAERRLFVRVRHIQKIECNTVYDDINTEPVMLKKPFEMIISDISMGGIGLISEQEISVGKILSIQLTLDNIPYEVKCEVIYCFRNDDKYRIGLKIVQKDKQFIRHLKIFVARISLKSNYA